MRTRVREDQAAAQEEAMEPGGSAMEERGKHGMIITGIVMPLMMLLGAVPVMYTERALAAEQQAVQYLGSTASRKYHASSCRMVKKITKEHQVTFASPEAAQKAGYEPCKICIATGEKKPRAAKPKASERPEAKSVTSDQQG